MMFDLPLRMRHRKVYFECQRALADPAVSDDNRFWAKFFVDFVDGRDKAERESLEWCEKWLPRMFFYPLGAYLFVAILIVWYTR